MHKHLLIEQLCQLPYFNNLKVTDIKVIDAGLSQPCFCVTYKQKDYFAKYLNVHSIEAIVAGLAAKQGISPQLLYVGRNWLITEFLEGEWLNKTLKSEDEKLAVMLALLSYCHRIDYKQCNVPGLSHENSNKLKKLKKLNLPIDDHKTPKSEIPTLDILAIANQLLASLNANEPLMNSLLSLLAALAHNLTKVENRVLNRKLVLCHGDANFSNAIQIKSGANNEKNLNQLIDFECACIAPKEYDFAMLLAVNEIKRSKISSIKFPEIESKNALLKADNSPVIVDNLACNNQCFEKTSLPLVTCYYDLSILINHLWYLNEFHSHKQENYKTLAKNQMSLLSSYHSQANTILDEMR